VFFLPPPTAAYNRREQSQISLPLPHRLSLPYPMLGCEGPDKESEEILKAQWVEVRYLGHGTIGHELVNTALGEQSCRECRLSVAKSNSGNTPRKIILAEPGHAIFDLALCTRPVAAAPQS